MESTGNSNTLRQTRTIQEGARIYLEAPTMQPTRYKDQAPAIILWVVLVLQFLTVTYTVVSNQAQGYENRLHDKNVEILVGEISKKLK